MYSYNQYNFVFLAFTTIFSACVYTAMLYLDVLDYQCTSSSAQSTSKVSINLVAPGYDRVAFDIR